MRQLAWRLSGSGQSAVESRTIAVFSAESTALRGVANGADDVVQLAVLRETGDGARVIERIDFFGLGGRREDDDGCRRACRSDRGGRLDSVELRQAIVHQDDVGRELRA